MLSGLLALFVAGAAPYMAAEDQALKPRLEVSGQIYMPDAKASGVSKTIEPGPGPTVLYVYAGKTLCEARTVSSQKPLVAGNGWRIELGPASSWVVVPYGKTPGSVPPGSFSVKVSWERLWEGGRTLTNGPSGETTLTMAPGSPIPIDTIDGSSRRVARETVNRLRTWKPGEPVPTEFVSDGQVAGYLNQLATLEERQTEMKTVRVLGSAHPEVLKVVADIRFTTRQLNDRIGQLIEAETRRGSVAAGAAVDGCAALSMNLQLELAESPASARRFEIDYWLVHRTPDGKETTQHQVVRTRVPNSADFYFDDIAVETSRGTVTLEVFGNTGSPMSDPGGALGLNFEVSRRFVTSSTAFGWRTKEGRNSFGGRFSGPGEVVSFQLPPLQDDDGVLVGHRFSLRIRMKVLL